MSAATILSRFNMPMIAAKIGQVTYATASGVLNSVRGTREQVRRSTGYKEAGEDLKRVEEVRKLIITINRLCSKAKNKEVIDKGLSSKLKGTVEALAKQVQGISPKTHDWILAQTGIKSEDLRRISSIMGELNELTSGENTPAEIVQIIERYRVNLEAIQAGLNESKTKLRLQNAAAMRSFTDHTKNAFKYLMTGHIIAGIANRAQNLSTNPTVATLQIMSAFLLVIRPITGFCIYQTRAIVTPCLMMPFNYTKYAFKTGVGFISKIDRTNRENRHAQDIHRGKTSTVDYSNVDARKSQPLLPHHTDVIQLGKYLLDMPSSMQTRMKASKTFGKTFNNFLKHAQGDRRGMFRRIVHSFVLKDIPNEGVRINAKDLNNEKTLDLMQEWMSWDPDKRTKELLIDIKRREGSEKRSFLTKEVMNYMINSGAASRANMTANLDNMMLQAARNAAEQLPAVIKKYQKSTSKKGDYRVAAKIENELKFNSALASMIPASNSNQFQNFMNMKPADRVQFMLKRLNKNHPEVAKMFTLFETPGHKPVSEGQYAKMTAKQQFDCCVIPKNKPYDITQPGHLQGVYSVMRTVSLAARMRLGERMRKNANPISNLNRSV